MQHAGSQIALLAVGAAGLLVGLALERRHRRGWYRRRHDPPARRTPRGCIAAATAVSWVLLSWSLPAPTSPVDAVVLLVHLGLACAVVTLAAVDVAVRRLPDVLTLPSGIVAVTGAALGVGLEHPPGHPGTALAAGIGVPATLLLLTVTVGGVGLGDVKLAIPLSVVLGWHGWDVVMVGTVLGWVLAGIAALALLIRGRARRDSPLPLGPFLGLGALLAVVG